MIIKNLVKKMVYGYKADSNSYVSYLRSKGMIIGNRVQVYVPKTTIIDESRPWLITIGDDVKITEGVAILTHGYDWSVLQGVYGDILGSAGEVKIGNNVFIGTKSIVLKGVNIGDNVIIGAGSLVNKDIPSNCVAAGNPCKVIMSLEEYHNRRLMAQEHEAKELVRNYKIRYGKEPGEKELDEFFWLFTKEPDQLPSVWKKKMSLKGKEDYSNKVLQERFPKYKSMYQFLADCDLHE